MRNIWYAACHWAQSNLFCFENICIVLICMAMHFSFFWGGGLVGVTNALLKLSVYICHVLPHNAASFMSSACLYVCKNCSGSNGTSIKGIRLQCMLHVLTLYWCVSQLLIGNTSTFINTARVHNGQFVPHTWLLYVICYCETIAMKKINTIKQTLLVLMTKEYIS